MYRLLIVDDESHIVDWLYEMFKSEEELNLDVYKAYDGDEALVWLEKTCIDIVLADISMPVMDGLMLMKEIKSRWPLCKVIFLTGHDNFDYIYEANKFDGVRYLLKSENDKMIIRAVSEAIADIERNNRESEIALKAEKDIKRAIPTMRREFLNDIIFGSVDAADISESVFRSMEIPLLPEHQLLLMVSLLDFQSSDRTPVRMANVLYIMESIVENLLGPKISFAAVWHERSYIVWFFQPKEDLLKFSDGSVPNTIWNITSSRLKSVLDKVQSSCSEILGIKVSFAVSEKICRWDLVLKNYSMLRRQLNIYAGSNSGVIVTGETYREETCIAGVSDDLGGSALLSKMQLLLSHLELRRREEYFSLLSQICNSLGEVKSLNYLPAIQVYYAISVQIMSYINTYRLWEKVAFKCALYKLSRFEEHGSWGRAAEYLEQISGIIFELQESEQQNRLEDTIAKLKKHIRENLSSELSVYSIGEALHFNPTYLSRVFKQSTGVALSSYITDLRIEKAKELLAGPDNKINEITKKIGCTSANYFCRLFKKVVGMTPQQYRDRMLAGSK